MRKFLTAGALAAAALGFAGLLGTTAEAAGYYAQNGKIHDPSGQQLQIRGINHYGFNADVLQPQFLWSMGWKEQIAQIKSLGFNAVRVPITPDTLYVQTTVDRLSYVDPGKNPELIGKTPLQVLDLWMAEADRQGLYLMLDMHSITNDRQVMTWFSNSAAEASLVYNGQPYTVDHWLRDLKFVAARYAGVAHFFAIDIYNEPNGIVRWSAGDPNVADPKYWWKSAAERAAAAILAANPNLLIFVQGISGNWDGVENSNIAMNWAENFQPQRYQPLNIPNDKLVLSPHTYGPDVYVKSSFSAPNFPANLAADWHTLFGQFYPTHPVIPGEWGGRYGQGGDARDVAWQNAFVDYMISKGMSDSFYWCYTPNSGDTGGILDDSLNVRQDKMTLLRRLWGSVASASSISLSAASVGVAQGTGSVRLVVRRSGGSAATSVKYATLDGSARAGSDYSAKTGTLSWAAGDMTSRAVSIALGKTAFSGTRSFSFVLSSPGSGAVLSSPSVATVNIAGAATPGSLGLTASSYTVLQSAGSLSVSVARSGGSAGAVSVKYATANGSALGGIDFSATTGTLNWAAGDSAPKTIRVPLLSLPPFTGSRSFTLKLSNPAGGALLATASASVTISGSGTVASYPQPYIASFTPASGGAGTVVSITGTGYTGLNQVSLGASAANFQVISDTQLQVTVPAGATSAQIALFNPQHAAWTPMAFTVTP